MHTLLLFGALAAALHLGPHGTRLLAADTRTAIRPGIGRHRRTRTGRHAAPRSRTRGATR